MIGVDYPCQRCIYFHKELLDGWKTACDAYPSGIPGALCLHGTIEELKHCKDGFGFKEKQAGVTSIASDKQTAIA